MKATAANFTTEERKFLLGLARRTIEQVVTQGNRPAVEAVGLAARLTTPRACFVTLTKKGELRGCIGQLTAREPLYRAVMNNAESAALHDLRFAPVRPAEVDQLEIEISVLTEPQPLRFDSPGDLLERLRPQCDGVVLEIGHRRATYLPQVWTQLPDPAAFLDSLAQKAGCAASAWRGEGVSVATYLVEAFAEAE